MTIGGLFLVQLFLAIIFDNFIHYVPDDPTGGLEEEGHPTVDDHLLGSDAESAKARVSPGAGGATESVAAKNVSFKSRLRTSTVNHCSRSVSMNAVQMSPRARPHGSANDLQAAELDLKKRIRDVVMNEASWFNELILFLIVCNTATMCAITYGQSEATSTALDLANTMFTLMFVVESWVRMYGLGLTRYWATGWNRFDCVVTYCSLLDVVLSLVGW